MPSFVQPHQGGVLIALKVQPRASRNEIGGVLGNELKVKVTAPPVDSAANEAVLRLLSNALDCPPRILRLVKGHSSRHKQVFVEGLTPVQVLAKLGPE